MVSQQQSRKSSNSKRCNVSSLLCDCVLVLSIQVPGSGKGDKRRSLIG